MTNAINPIAAASYPVSQKPPPPAEPPAETAPASAAPVESPKSVEAKLQRLLAQLDTKLVDARLVIERDEARNDYIYKLVDTRTGEVRQRWPRPTVMEMIREMAPGRQTALLLDSWV